MTGVQFLAGAGIFLFATSSRLTLGPTQPPTQQVPGAFSLDGRGIKWPGHEADYSPSSSTKAKNVRSYTTIPPHIFMVWCLIKHRDFIHTDYESCNEQMMQSSNQPRL
jgi:hypothetical protein